MTMQNRPVHQEDLETALPIVCEALRQEKRRFTRGVLPKASLTVKSHQMHMREAIALPESWYGR